MGTLFIGLDPQERNGVFDLYLKKVEIQGFKSFAEKTEVEFNSKVTAIVGPNGSGKSNIADAIRWVLGEQSVKSLRGIRMEDIIFSGTEKRRALGFSEVTITFENSSGKIPIEYSEVAVTRRMFRSGESEYYINKNSCRLKDVRELFMDTGVGKEGYSIIGQGKIDEILSNKPEDRRNIFEEAAGIIKYKTRKQEAIRKLEKTEANLTRIGDLLHEIRKQKDQLKEEAERAGEFQRLFSQLRDLDVAMASRELRRMSSSLEKLDTKENELYEEKNILDLDSKAIEDSFGGVKSSLENAEKKIENKRSLKLENFQKNEGIKNKIKLLQEREAYLLKEIDRYNREIKDGEVSFSEGGGFIEQSQIEHQETEKQGLLLEEIKKEYDIEKTKILNEISLLESLSTNMRNEILDHQTKAFSIKSEATTVGSFIESIRKRRDKLLVEISSIREEILEKSNERSKISVILTDKNQELNSRKEWISELENELLTLTQKVELSEREFYENEKIHGNLSATLRLYENMERDFEGYYGSVKSIAKRVKEDQDFGIGYIGLVADLFTVEEKLLKAIEISLGSNVQNIVVENEDTARRLIGYLKESKKGRATFLPVSTIKGQDIHIHKEHSSAKGFLGIASSLISCDKRLKGIFSQLLGRTLIFDTLDNALDYSKISGYKNRVVTLEGDIVNPGGSLTGGSTGSKNTSILSRKQAIESLHSEISTLSDKLVFMKSSLESFKADITSLTTKITVLLTENERIAGVIKENEHYLSSIEYEDGKLNRELEKKNSESAALEDELQQLIENSTRLAIEASETEAHLENRKSILRDNEDELTSLRTQLGIIDGKINDLRLDISISKNKLESIESKIKAYLLTKDDMKASLEAKKTELASLFNQVTENRAEIRDLNSLISDFQEIEAKESDELSRLLSEKDKFMNSFYELQERNRILMQRLSKVEREIDKLDMDRSRYDIQIETLIDRMQTDYDLDKDAVLSVSLQVDNVREDQNTIKDLRSRIKELGNVNLGSIEDYRNAVERFQFLTSQLEDLNSAREDIQVVIRDMEKRMRVQFKRSFDEINEKFQQTFSILFNGGKARLELEDGEDILTSGIEIMAQPPGKKLQSLMLLSGGEKSLTAVALLFAILKTKPSPFCILDEIDAALDEANISRYTNYLRTFDDETQFVLITHRKTTMEIADILYGVTMEEEGVSRLISLRLKDYSEAAG